MTEKVTTLDLELLAEFAQRKRISALFFADSGFQNAFV